ncbi:MAG: sulfatase [Proteobacteria bacterium]|nr:sulfatase [Pseudomonadota bacterium]MCP4918948.1 sulfatase [Pseudomonadota bacterium]
MIWLLAACAGTKSPDAAPPDIVLVTIDTLRRDHLGVYGYPLATSPRLDELAASGTVFERAYAPSGWTAPSMTSLFTGLWPAQHGVDHARVDAKRAYGQPVLPPSHETLAEALQSAGYETFGVSTNGHVKAQLGHAQGFDHWVEHSFFGDNDATLAAVESWSEPLSKSEKPRFVWLHFMAPHAPYVEREQFAAFQRDGVDDRVAAYDSEVAYVDEGVGRALELLSLDEAVVFVTSDHGELLGDPQGWGHGGIAEPLVRIPLIVSGPGVVTQRVSSSASLVDLKSTLVELAGGTPAPTAGKSQAAVLGGAELEDRELIVTSRRGGSKDGLVDGTVKVVWGANDRRGHVYELVSDPTEVRPRANKELVATSMARFDELNSSPTPVPPLSDLELELSDAEYEKLKLLGYVD